MLGVGVFMRSCQSKRTLTYGCGLFSGSEWRDLENRTGEIRVSGSGCFSASATRSLHVGSMVFDMLAVISLLAIGGLGHVFHMLSPAAAYSMIGVSTGILLFDASSIIGLLVRNSIDKRNSSEEWEEWEEWE
ncbi:MAG: hypothetical protein K940chlam9_01098 [Chlamydiae bacterium]|nr:hypothetical protein [Chlamydiota bacterium]